MRPFWEVPADREVEASYERADRLHRIALPLTCVIVGLQVLALGLPAPLLAFPALMVVLHFALRGWTERHKAERIAKTPRLTRAELRSTRTAIRIVVPAALALMWIGMAVPAIVIAPRALVAGAVFMAPLTILAVVVVRKATRHYDDLLAQRDRPERV